MFLVDSRLLHVVAAIWLYLSIFLIYFFLCSASSGNLPGVLTIHYFYSGFLTPISLFIAST